MQGSFGRYSSFGDAKTRPGGIWRDGFEELDWVAPYDRRALGLTVTPFPLKVLFNWLPQAFAVHYWRRFFAAEMGDYVFGRHARAASAEMQEVTNDCRMLPEKSGVPAPALRQLYASVHALCRPASDRRIRRLACPTMSLPVTPSYVSRLVIAAVHELSGVRPMERFYLSERHYALCRAHWRPPVCARKIKEKALRSGLESGIMKPAQTARAE
jgi:hypothetical protein